jgi:archaellum component FlaF (FlaF/FlaG flagellin family)
MSTILLVALVASCAILLISFIISFIVFYVHRNSPDKYTDEENDEQVEYINKCLK